MISNGCRRLAMRILLCAAVGAAITILVAWTVVMVSPKARLVSEGSIGARQYTDARGRTFTAEVWAAQRWAGPATRLYTSHRVKGQLWGTGGTINSGSHPRAVLAGWGRELEPGAAFVGAPFDENNYGDDTRVDERRCLVLSGWPLGALWSGFDIGPESLSGYQPRCGIDLDGGSFGPDGGRPRILPLRPMYPGFALDSALYATLTCALWWVPKVIRRKRRRARGYCLECGYDLERKGVVACPECGAAPATQ
jgi:hypothetical protein